MRPGITEVEFKQLFVQCSCGNFFMKRTCREHTCLKEVIDLTGGGLAGGGAGHPLLLLSLHIQCVLVSSYNQSPFICNSNFKLLI